jgi:type II secretory pathway pseudopilin PulG
MGALAQRIRRAGREEGGFTLTELLVSMGIGLAVVASGVLVFTSAIRAEPKITNRSAQIQQARTVAETVTRELRQGSNAASASPSQLQILTFIPKSSCASQTAGISIRCKVFYSCSTAGACTRQVCPPNTVTPGAGCGSAYTVVEGLSTNQVFAFSPALPGKAFVTIKLAFPAADGDDAITLEDGAALRNPPLGTGA